MQLSKLLAFLTPLLLVSGAAINARAPHPDADAAGVTVFASPTDTPSVHALEKRKQKTTIIIIIIIKGAAAMAATGFGQPTGPVGFETYTSTKTVVNAVTGEAKAEGFGGWFGGKGDVITVTSTRFEGIAPVITDAAVAE